MNSNIKPQETPVDAAKKAQDFSSVAVIIPCLNEEAAIGTVVSDIRKSLPGATIYVFDNASTDDTARVAASLGCEVRSEPRRGKGQVVRRMFRDVEAEIYVMVDGDMTYDASAAATLVEVLRTEHLDAVIGARKAEKGEAYRRGHRFGNWALNKLITHLFRAELADMLSGYRVMSRRFVKSFPVESSGFEIETELTVHMLQLDAPHREVAVGYVERPEGTQSKLRTWVDGFRILRTILSLLSLERPMATFGGFGLGAIVLSLVMFIPVLIEFQETGLVPRLPTLVVSSSLGMTGLVSVFSGMILSGITRTRRDMKRLAFLAIPSHGPARD